MKKERVRKEVCFLQKIILICCCIQSILLFVSKQHFDRHSTAWVDAESKRNLHLNVHMSDSNVPIVLTSACKVKGSLGMFPVGTSNAQAIVRSGLSLENFCGKLKSLGENENK